MPRPSRWQEILQAAAEEFREHGYENITIEDISNRVGILKGSLYHYISTKQDLLLAVIEPPATDLLSALEEFLATEDPNVTVTARLRRLFRLQVAIFAEHYPAAFVYLRHIGLASHRQDFREMDARYMAAVERLIEEGARRGEFALAATPGVTARAVVGMLDWMQHWFRPRSPAEDEALADQLVALALGGLSGGGGMLAALRSADATPTTMHTTPGEAVAPQPPDRPGQP